MLKKTKSINSAPFLIVDHVSSTGTKHYLTAKMNIIPFQAINWVTVERSEHKGETGTAYWQTLQFGDLRVRLVEYTAGYLADHWCQKGHIVHCLEGSFVSELQSGEQFTLTPGMSYIVSDEQSSHRSISKNGVKLLIIDGGFLKAQLITLTPPSNSSPGSGSPPPTPDSSPSSA